MVVIAAIVVVATVVAVVVVAAVVDDLYSIAYTEVKKTFILSTNKFLITTSFCV